MTRKVDALERRRALSRARSDANAARMKYNEAAGDYLERTVTGAPDALQREYHKRAMEAYARWRQRTEEAREMEERIRRGMIGVPE